MSIFCAKETYEPTLTTLVQPRRSETGSSCNIRLTHPAIQEVITIQCHKFQFRNPWQRAAGTKYKNHLKTDICIMIVANARGLPQYVNQHRFECTKTSNSRTAEHACQAKAYRLWIDGGCTLQGLYSSSATLALNMLHPPYGQAPLVYSVKDIDSIIQPTSLRFYPDDVMYTNGSRKRCPTWGL